MVKMLSVRRLFKRLKNRRFYLLYLWRFLTRIAGGISGPFIWPYMRDHGVTMIDVGIINSISQITNSLMGVFGGVIADFLDYRKIVLFATLCEIIGFLLFVFGINTFMLVIIGLGVLMNIGIISLIAINTALARAKASVEALARSYAFLEISHYIAGVIAPFIGLLLIAVLPMRNIFIISASLVISIIILLIPLFPKISTFKISSSEVKIPKKLFEYFNVAIQDLKMLKEYCLLPIIGGMEASLSGLIYMVLLELGARTVDLPVYSSVIAAISGAAGFLSIYIAGKKKAILHASPSQLGYFMPTSPFQELVSARFDKMGLHAFRESNRAYNKRS